MNGMTTKAWLCTAFGIVLALLMIVSIWYDVEQVEDARRTISAWALAYGTVHWWFPFALTAFGVGSVMALATHLWLPRSGDVHAFAPSMLGAAAGVAVGCLIGWWFLQQIG